MKKYISSAASIDDIHNGAFSELANSAYNEGYNLSITDDMHMTLTPLPSNKDYVPTVEIETINTNGIYTFEATVSFPTIACHDIYYPDGFAYYVKKWTQLAEFITELNEFYYDPSEWIDE